MKLLLLIRAVMHYRLGSHELQRSRQCGVWSDEAMNRAQAHLNAADALHLRCRALTAR